MKYILNKITATDNDEINKEPAGIIISKESELKTLQLIIP